jgi:RHS repeat-associated protein
MTTQRLQNRNVTTSTSGRRVAWDRMGTMLADYNGVDSGIRYYGTNGHRDTAWIADGTGAVTATVRYDPWGSIIASSGTTPDWRFQGSWYDTSTDLQWVITRWYAPTLGRFISEDTLLGEPTNPLSRHLYAYAEGDPVGGWDPDGRAWHSVSFEESRAHRRSGGHGKFENEAAGELNAMRFRVLGDTFYDAKRTMSIDSTWVKYDGPTSQPGYSSPKLQVDVRATLGWESGHLVTAGFIDHEIWIWLVVVSDARGAIDRILLRNKKQHCGGAGPSDCEPNDPWAVDRESHWRSGRRGPLLVKGERLKLRFIARASISVDGLFNGWTRVSVTNVNDAKLDW